MEDNCCQELRSIAQRLIELANSMEKEEASEPEEAAETETKKPQSVADLKVMSEALSKKEQE